MRDPKDLSTLSLPFGNYQAVIDNHAEEAHAEILAMAAAAREHVNRSVGQMIRWSRERCRIR